MGAEDGSNVGEDIAVRTISSNTMHSSFGLKLLHHRHTLVHVHTEALLQRLDVVIGAPARLPSLQDPRHTHLHACIALQVAHEQLQMNMTCAEAALSAVVDYKDN